MRIIFLFLMFSMINPVIGQVGVNTISPTKELDVNGELRIRNLPIMNNSLDVLSADLNGNTGKISNIKFLKEVYFDEATNPINYTMYSTGLQIVDNVNLGLTNTVVIPARVKATLIVNYSVPMGLAGSFDKVNGYYGIRFLRNNVEAQAGSRKYSIPDRYLLNSFSNDSYSMVSVSTTFIEVVNNSANNNPLTITYSLNGYIEQRHSNASPVEYRFNMWSSSGNNYNWGKSFISTQMYIHN
ncbi:hypothetical protein ACFQO1_07805 [Jejudonia soesokkakensis]|uniref:Uncharacterized protein n=1 Tax=Jejudonia soesokkakensis TaxID=1323432 RepID=A0ABW2MVN9_9FLAO